MICRDELNDNSRCINAWNTNITLENTFRFLKSKQVQEDKSTIATRVYLGIASKNSLSFDNFRDRDNVYNVISGVIKRVENYYVVIEFETSCPEVSQEYVIAYGDIENIQSELFALYYKEYIEFMGNLHKVCKESGNKYYDMLQALKYTIKKYKNSPNVNIVIIYGGSFSLPYSPAVLEIVDNLITVTSTGLIPITTVDGFFTVTDPLLTKEKELN